MTTSILVNGTGTLTPITLKKNYLNSIGTDSVLAYDAEQQVNPTSTGKVTNRYYYHTNQLGSVIAISTSTGLVLQKYTYNAYGKPYIYSGSTLTALSSYTGTLYGNTRLYTGREYDRETGYYYLRARTYSPDLGRFLSRDPIGQNDQVNLYTYVANSPLMGTDRDGKRIKKATVVVITVSAKILLGAFNMTIGGYDLVGDPLDDQENINSIYDDQENMNLHGLALPGVAIARYGFKIVIKGGVKVIEKDAVNVSEKTFQTYTKRGPNGEIYTGRTSGYGTPEENVQIRDSNHHMNKEGYGPAELDRSSSSSDAIRGREQQLIDMNGGAQSVGGTSGNKINGISLNNPKRQQYLDALSNFLNF